VLPRVAQRASAAAAHVDVVVRAGDGVEAHGVDDHVELALTVGGLDAVTRDAHDRRRAQVDEFDVRTVVRLVVVRLHRDAARAEAVVVRDQLLRELLVVHALADLVGGELADELVGALVDQQVTEVAEPDAEAGVAPVPITATRLPVRSRSSGQSEVWNEAPAKSSTPGHGGGFGIDSTPIAETRKGADAVEPSSNVTVHASSLHSARVIRRPKVMSRRRSNRSTTCWR